VIRTENLNALFTGGHHSGGQPIRRSTKRDLEAQPVDTNSDVLLVPSPVDHGGVWAVWGRVGRHVHKSGADSVSFS
jgi:hypothetical protein